jgi:hypothetical protein
MLLPLPIAIGVVEISSEIYIIINVLASTFPLCL